MQFRLKKMKWEISFEFCYGWILLHLWTLSLWPIDRFELCLVDYIVFWLWLSKSKFTPSAVAFTFPSLKKETKQ